MAGRSAAYMRAASADLLAGHAGDLLGGIQVERFEGLVELLEVFAAALDEVRSASPRR